ncbi:MAG: sulfite exporter TauE/SafE family protein [Oscillospiraceae bacterium]
MKEKTLFTENMTCTGCESRLEKRISAIEGVSSAKASFTENKITVTFDEELCSCEDIIKAVEGEGYSLKKEKSGGASDAVSVIIIVIGVYVIAKALGIANVFRYFPEAREGMSYAALFAVGSLTSVHCAAMCGGINLTASVGGKSDRSVQSALLYNLGRVISYTLIGAVLGGIGSAAAVSVKARAVVGLIAGVFMIIMGLNMLGSFGFLRKLSVRMPKSLIKKLYGGKNHGSFYIGLINGFMPCGPLQSMQLFAIASGSAVQGALSMLFFSLGTVPLMLFFGAVAGKLKKSFKHKMTAASAALILIFGIVMIDNNAALSGLYLPEISTNTDNAVKSQIINGTQYIETELDFGSYEPISVTNGIPVEWTINADEEKLNGCNNEIVIPEYNISVKLKSGENVIRFTPEKTGIFTYTCWMGMIKSTIVVT